MRLQVMVPHSVVDNREALRISAESPLGAFTILPKHIDFVTTLVPGIVSFVTPDDVEHYLAVDQGILVKRGPDVIISTHSAIPGDNLGELRQVVQKEFTDIDAQETKARNALIKLEASFVRRFMETREGRRE